MERGVDLPGSPLLSVSHVDRQAREAGFPSLMLHGPACCRGRLSVGKPQSRARAVGPRVSPHVLGLI